MDATKTIKKRRSIRSYQPKPIPKKLIKELLGLANLAPSASNLQNRSFIVIRNKKTIKKVYEAAFKQSHILEAPVVIAFAMDKNKYDVKKFLKKNEEWGTDLWGATAKDYKNNKLFCLNWKRWTNLWPIHDVDAAITTLTIAATAKGLSSCWIGLFEAAKVKKILKVPKNYEVIALLTLGYQKNPPYSQKRKPVEELIAWFETS